MVVVVVDVCAFDCATVISRLPWRVTEMDRHAVVQVSSAGVVRALSLSVSKTQATQGKAA